MYASVHIEIPPRFPRLFRMRGADLDALVLAYVRERMADIEARVPVSVSVREPPDCLEAYTDDELAGEIQFFAEYAISDLATDETFCTALALLAEEKARRLHCAEKA